MKKIIVLILASFVFVVTTASPIYAASQSRFFISRDDVFGSDIDLAYWSEDKNLQAEDEINYLISILNMVTDNYKMHTPVDPLVASGIYHINKGMVGTKYEVHKFLYEILLEAERLRLLTDGYFDYTIGYIIDVWKDEIGKKLFQEITDSELEEIATMASVFSVYDQPIELAIENGRYYVTKKEDMKMDLGALAKGYTTQRIADVFDKYNISSYYINGGRSSIILKNYSMKEPTDNLFAISYEDPRHLGLAAGDLLINNTSITTSGSTVQYVLNNGQKYHHIISPKTKMPELHYYGITLLSGDAGANDAISTALYSVPQDEFEGKLKEWSSKQVDYIFVNTGDELVENTPSHEFVSKFDPGYGVKTPGTDRYIWIGVLVAVTILIIGVGVFVLIKNRHVLKQFLRDGLIVGGIIIMAACGFGVYKLVPRNNNLAAIYYEKEVLVEVDFVKRTVEIIKTQDDKYPYVDLEQSLIYLLGAYKVDGKQTEFIVQYDFGEKKIRVYHEVSPNGICSKQGWSNQEPRVCIPNKISINFVTGSDNGE